MQSYYSCNRLGYNLLVLSTTSSSCPSLQASSNRGQLKKIKDSKWWHFWKLCSSRMSFICKLLQFNQKSVQPSLRAPRSIQTSRIRVNWSFKKSLWSGILQHMSTVFENHQKCLIRIFNIFWLFLVVFKGK